MIDKIDPSQIQDFVEKASKLTHSAKADTNQEADASLQANYAAFIEKAKSTQTDSSAVQRAKELLLTGQLDSPENIKKAAENIIKFGL